MQALLNAPADNVLYIYNGYASVSATLKLFDLEKQVVPIAQVASTPIVLLVRNDSPHKSAKDLWAYARANPGKLTYGTLGAGGVEHLKWTQIEKSDGFQGHLGAVQRHPADSMQGVLTGEIDCLLTAGLFAKLYVPKAQARARWRCSSPRAGRTSRGADHGRTGVNVPPLAYWGGYVAKAGTRPRSCSAFIARSPPVQPRPRCSNGSLPPAPCRWSAKCPTTSARSSAPTSPV
jgi:tripartite-type tricarboxylate transporter receptor subunit TctC